MSEQEQPEIKKSRKSGRIIDDVELLAMADVVEALSELSEAQVQTVLFWANRRYQQYQTMTRMVTPVEFGGES